MAGDDAVPLFRFHPPPGAAAALEDVLRGGHPAAGELVAKFEHGLAPLLGVPDVVATSDRSGALTLALRLAGVGPGDEVILPALCCTATSMPIANVFATPRWADVDPRTGMVDATTVAPLVTPRTRAIVVYHWGGDVADLDALGTLARAHGLVLISEASAALGASWCGAPLAAAAGPDFTIFSFYAATPLGIGEGGALCCARSEDAAVARRCRRYGIDPVTFRLPNRDLNPASDIPVAGYNFAMTNLSAALGLAQLPHVPRLVSRHQDNGRFFDAALSDVAGLALLKRDPRARSAYWVYAMRAQRRDALVAKLAAVGIGAQRLHVRNDRYTCFTATQCVLPGVDRFDAENLAIPCGWWIDDAARQRIVATIRSGW
ncbi:MAG: DegT/DnrJ/EryC1/StrS family aminotransferase [Gammaproteobacteria bacterium]|nr:DegT/DnrJ/EryC1/StrS family aminotransferase [Gammaproteobacteria bacterium]